MASQDAPTTIGLLGGSFNPVHRGHVDVARYMVDHAGVDAVWLSLSPANPLKQPLAGATDADRRAMLRLATAPYAPSVGVTDIELQLPRPSYTINTLDHLARLHPQYRFRLIIGSDNWLIFNRWRDYQRILSDYGVIVYPRPGYECMATGPGGSADIPAGVQFMPSAPQIDLSSTSLRQLIASRADISQYVAPEVNNYIHQHNLYTNGVTDTE